MFKKVRLHSAADRLLEESLYERVVVELNGGQKRDGLWAKALADSNGSEERAKSLYIRYRVQSIKDEAELSEAIAEAEASADAEARANAEARAKARAKALAEARDREIPLWLWVVIAFVILMFVVAVIDSI